MKSLLVAFFTVFTSIAFAQEIERIEVSGLIVVQSNDKEGVTVYNTSSNQGTITNKDGSFKILVALNDVVEFAALQFQDFSVVINKDILASKQMTVILVEEVNKLDEVVLLSYGLSGDLDADIESLRTYNVSMDAIYFGLNNMDDFEFHQDYKSKITNPSFDAYHPRVDNMLNFVNIAGALVKAILPKKEKKESKLPEITPLSKAFERYKLEYYTTNFNIQEGDINAFKSFVEKQDIDIAFLETENEMQFLEHLTKLSNTFLNQRLEKN